MDLDAYSAAHAAEWDRLARIGAAPPRDGVAADELIDVYQAGSTQLSTIATTVGESVQGDRLSLALSRARLRFTGAPANPLRQLTVLFALQLPAALYRVRWLTLVIAAITVLIAVVYYGWISTHPEVLAALGPRDKLKALADTGFVNYYSDNSPLGFTGQVWTNNALIAAECIVFGIVPFFVPAVIFSNAQNIGVDAAVLGEFGKLNDFFLYIAPHGQLELYSIFTAAAAGLMIFWSWVAPGARTRRQALAEDGRAFFCIVIGLILSLLCSGIIEGVVTRQPWPWPIKIGIGTFALAAFLVYQWGVGRRARRLGQTGDLSEAETGARQIISI
ncbi:MAG: stage II sporulation protein M [Actinomycetota bacterium]|nr:stage II sporulation protein M [Actinomycetota bacterium]